LTDYEIIKKHDEIIKYQRIFEDIFKKNSIFNKFENIEIPFRGESEPCDIYWSEKYKFWYTSFEYTEEGHRYCNWFGISEDKPNRKLKNYVFELSISIHNDIKDCKRHKEVAGNFIKEGEKVFVTHNGGIKQGKEFFWKHYNGKEIYYKNGKLAIFGELIKMDHREFIENVKNFIEQVKEIKEIAKKEKNSVGDNETKKQSKSINKIQNKIKINNNKDEENNGVKTYKIAQNIREIILSINENCKLQKKKDIFDQAALFKLWGNIEKACKNKSDFKDFAENLYKLLRETTRYKNPNKKNRDDPHYIFLIPDNFIKKDPTKHFWDIVNTLRHYFVHDEIGNIADVYKELLDISSGPETSEDYIKLQIKVLKLFENAMKLLLDMVKNDINRLRYP